jgi:integrase
MASISTYDGGKRLIEFWISGERYRVKLGDETRKGAETVCTHIENLLKAKKIGRLEDITADWLGKIDEPMHAKLVRAGLTHPRRAAASAALGAFIDQFLAGRPDFKHFTRVNFNQVKKKLVGYFGENRELRGISADDAERFRQSMIDDEYGENSMGRVIGRCRQLFKVAIRRGLYDGANPFDGMSAAVRADKSRQFFITREVIGKVLDACPDAQWRCLVALARYGGLRTPSESLALKWSDVDFPAGRIRIPSCKTERHAGHESRIIPMFPELREYLEDAHELAGPDDEFVITRYRDTSCNLRTQLQRIIDKAKVNRWQKLWQNLRSSRQTELAETYPLHVVCAWIGNSRAVAQEHYLQITDAHFARAIGGTENTGGENRGESAATSTTQNGSNVPSTNENPPERPGENHPELCCASGGHPRQGKLEEQIQAVKSGETKNRAQFGGSFRGEFPPELQKLIDAWPNLTERQRAAIMTVVAD